MARKTSGSVVSLLLGFSLFSPGFVYAQEAGQPQANPAAQKYKLTIMENAATTRRVKKGRVSAEAVVRVTDTNNLPVPGITVTFLLPQYGSGAAFGTGGLSSVVTTNAAGIATSSSITATAGSSLSVSVSAAVPGGMLTGTVPISTGAAAAGAGGAAAGGAAGGGGLSTGVIVGIAAAVVAGGVAAAAASGAFGGKGSSGTTTPPAVTVTIGSPASGGITFGPPK